MRAARDVNFFVSVLVECGLFWSPLPPPGTTAREIGRQARAAISGDEVAPWVARWLEEFAPRDPRLKLKWLTSSMHQTMRGGRLILVGPHRGRRPAREVTVAVQLMDRHLRETTPKSARARRECIAGALLAVEGRSTGMDEPDENGRTPREAKADEIRMRLERARPLDETSYRLALWRADARLDPNTPFPFRQRVAVELEPRSGGQMVVKPFGGPYGMAWEQFEPLLDRAIRIRRTVGKLLKPELLELEIDPPGRLRRIVRIPGGLPRLPWSEEETIWPRPSPTDRGGTPAGRPAGPARSPTPSRQRTRTPR